MPGMLASVCRSRGRSCATPRSASVESTQYAGIPARRAVTARQLRRRSRSGERDGSGRPVSSAGRMAPSSDRPCRETSSAPTPSIPARLSAVRGRTHAIVWMVLPSKMQARGSPSVAATPSRQARSRRTVDGSGVPWLSGTRARWAGSPHRSHPVHPAVISPKYRRSTARRHERVLRNDIIVLKACRSRGGARCCLS